MTPEAGSNKLGPSSFVRLASRYEIDPRSSKRRAPKAHGHALSWPITLLDP